MKQTYFTGVLVTLTGLLSTQLTAMPFAGNKCKITIKAPNNGAGVIFDENCTTAYVLPPILGKAEISQIAKNANMNFCPAVLSVANTTTSLVNSISTISKKIEELIADYDILDQELAKEKLLLEDLKIKAVTSEARYESAKEQEEKLMQAYSNAQDALKFCKLDGESCDSEESAVQEAKGELKIHLIGELDESKKQYQADKAAADNQDKTVKIKQSAYTDGIQPALDMLETITGLNSQVNDIYKQYAPLEGASAQITYSIEWDKLIQDYQSKNPDLNLAWLPMPVKHAELSAVVRHGNGNPSSLPAILWSHLPGSEKKGLGYPTTESESLEGALTVPNESTINFGGSASGQMQLSLLGICPYAPNGVNTVIDKISANELTAHMVANVDLAYELAARRGYEASYHMSNFMSRVEKKKKKGGFFSSKNVHELIVEKSSSDWFNIKFNAKASEFQYTPAEQTEITQEVKAGLIERALRNVAFSSMPANTPPPMPDQIQTGAGALSQKMYGSFGCSWWRYCRYAAFTLGALDSIFGNQTAVSKFQESNNSWAHEKVEGIAIIERSAGITFVAEKELTEK